MHSIYKTLLLLLICSLLSSSYAAAAGEDCVVDDDCDYAHVCDDGECAHKTLSPLSALDLVGFFVTLLFAILANSAGVGGGVFFVPIYILVLSFDTKVAVALSNITICPALILRFFFAYKKRHPDKNAPLINYDVAVIFSPCIILGTTFGVLANKVLPNIVLVVLIIVILTATSLKTFRNGFKLYNKEKNTSLGKPTYKPAIQNTVNPTALDAETKRESEKTAAESTNHEMVALTVAKEGQAKDLEKIPEKVPEKIVKAKDTEELQKIEAYQSKLVQWDKFMFIATGVLILFFLTLLRGSKGTESPIGVESCSVGYWALWFAFVPVAAIMTYLAMKKVSKEYDRKERAGYEFSQSDRKYDAKTCMHLAKVGFITGTTSGILGVGGAVFTGPLMLGLGFKPEVSSFTATFLAMFTSVSSTLQYLMIGLIPMTYGAIVAPISVLGCCFIHRYRYRSCRPHRYPPTRLRAQ